MNTYNDSVLIPIWPIISYLFRHSMPVMSNINGNMYLNFREIELLPRK